MAEPLLLCVDMGTTRTRVWLTDGTRVQASANGGFGVRDVAAGRTRTWLLESLTALLARLLDEGRQAGVVGVPEAVLAAGMITSPEGLSVVPHCEAPASVDDLAAHLRREALSIPQHGEMPMFLVPGVRTGGKAANFASTLEMDVMRGEETLCIGLLNSGGLDEGTALLNLGSHWKWIWIDAEQRIARSRTLLTGEMVHAIQAHTLIASALPQTPPELLDPSWLERGFLEARRSGLSRALFCIRLLAQNGQGTDADRLAFLYGAFFEAELKGLKRAAEDGVQAVLMVGNGPLCAALQNYAQSVGLRATVLQEEERERTYLQGLIAIYRAAGVTQRHE